jgi:hypothetical protein
MTSGQVQRLRGVDVKAPEETQPADQAVEPETDEEPAEVAVAEGDES